LRNDKIISLSQARRGSIVHKSTAVFCSVHGTVEISLFCLKCDHLICTQCLDKNHSGHNISSLNQIRDSKAEQLNKIIKTLQEKKSVYEKAFDIEGQNHSRFSKSVDQVRKEITDQKTKIIEEVNFVCNDQFRELSKIQQNEDKRYSDSCNLIQSQNQAMASAIQTAQKSIASNITALIIQATMDTTQTLNGLEDPTMPPTTTATYQPGDRSHPNICQVQGKVIIEQGAKPILMTDIKKIEVKNQKASDDNKQQKHDVNKPRIDVRVKAKSTIKLKNKENIEVIVPLKNKTAWVAAERDKHLSLIDSTGRIIAKSVKLAKSIYDAKEYENTLIVTCHKCKVYQMSADGKSKSTFCKLSPYETRGLCVTKDMEVMVCLQASEDSEDNKVVRLGRSGEIIQTIQNDRTGAPLYNDPQFVTSLTTGEVIVTEAGNRIVGVDREGHHVFTWDLEIQGGKVDKYSLHCITHDSNNNLFVTDYNEGVYLLGNDGSGAISLLDSTQGIIFSWAIALDNDGQLWVGCLEGNIHIIEFWCQDK